ncbi:MAG: hypothetical protein EOP00_17960 [Pedobacter sp.]|nr:MAG: hypothetical protein EOP00_17960 [Pedobacter sp.]
MRFLFTMVWLILFAETKAQNFTGTWDFTYRAYPNAAPTKMQLKIGKSVEKMLYPANLQITKNDMIFNYELLLVKKGNTQLGIGRNKYPIKEKPFKIGQWMPYLNGLLTFGNTKDGQAQLTLKRMWIDNFGLFMKGLEDDDEIYESSKVNLRNLLYREPITLTKVNDLPWEHANIRRIVSADEQDEIYYGIYDLINTKDSVVNLAIQDEQLIDADTITLIQNGRVILNKHAIDEKKFSYALKLDKGLNTIALFADNYGRRPPNTANLIVKAIENMYSFDFTHRSNAFATFLVAKFYRTLTDPEKTVAKSLNKIEPGISKKVEVKEKVAERIGDVVANMQVANKQIELEIWDNQVEDGDNVSLKVNDEWVHQNIAVKKVPKKFNITLQPGKNTLLFRADNLGNIPPNTAVLRINYGAKSRLVYLDTDLKKDNVINIELK